MEELNSVDAYVRAQRSNLGAFYKLPHFKLVDLSNQLYSRAIHLVPASGPIRYGKFLLLGHQSFLAGATLIGQGQPFDAGPITRRAIEMARVCLASKYDPEAYEKWLAYEKRDKRWRAREAGTKPPPLPPIRYDLPANHPVVARLEKELGVLSDGFVHFTPEYFASQSWKDDGDPPAVKLNYFCSDQMVIAREWLLLSECHAHILQVIDECLDRAFTKDAEWARVLQQLYHDGSRMGDAFKKKSETKESKSSR